MIRLFAHEILSTGLFTLPRFYSQPRTPEKAGVDNADELIAGNDSPEKIAYDLLMSAKPAAKPKTEFNKPVTQQAQDNDVEHKTFADACASYRKTNNSTYREAQKACSTMYPELFEKSTHNSVDKER